MAIWRRSESWFPWYRPQAREADLERELRDHLELEAEEQQAAGLSSEEATHAAHRALDNILQVEEDVRAAWGFRWVETLLQDLRFGLRMLRRSPRFITVAVLTLALGIGANTAIFSIVDAVLLRPLPFRNPSSLLMFYESNKPLGFAHAPASAPDLMVVEREQKSFSSLGAFQNKDFDLSDPGEPERVTAARVSASIFPMLGIRPLLGRTYTRHEDQAATHVVVLSYGLWERRYGGNRNIVGQTIDLDRVPYTVVGVRPRSFQFPLPGPR